MTPGFDQFVAKFPPVDLPITLGEETHHVFGIENDPLSDYLVAQYILTEADGDPDEFTEFVPCFSLALSDAFVALVWWKAGLMQYEYVLATFDKKGAPIARKVIAFTRADHEQIARAVATIDEEWRIFMAAGKADAATDYMEPSAATMHEVEIMPNGQIV